MAQISSSFSNASPGRLKIAFSASFFQGTNRDAGFPSGASDWLLCATVNGVNTSSLSRNVPSVYAEVDYPGGNVVWSVATTTISTLYGGGTQSWGFTNLKLILQLVKK